MAETGCAENILQNEEAAAESVSESAAEITPEAAEEIGLAERESGGAEITADSPKPPPKKRRLRFKKKYIKWIALGLIVLLVALAAAQCANQVRAVVSMVSVGDTTVLAYSDAQNSISATGTVASRESRTVYSTMSYPVAEVMAEVGDRVEEGAVLCQLDAKTLQEQIDEKELSMSATQKANAQSIKTARDNYDNFKEGVEQGTNSSLITAESSVQNAKDSLAKAKKVYDEYRASLQRGDNTQLNSQKSALDSAEIALDAAWDAYDAARKTRDEARAAYDAAGGSDAEKAAAEAEVAAAQAAVTPAQAARDIAKQTYDTLLAAAPPDESAITAALTALTEAEGKLSVASAVLQGAQAKLANLSGNNKDALKQALEGAQAALDAKETTLDNAQNSYNNADTAYKAALRGSDSTLDDYEKNIESAQRAYDTAVESLKAAQAGAQNQLESYQNSIGSAQASGNNDTAEKQLAKLYADLEDTAIKAPMTGTVTAVYATVGATGSGQLFVVEDTDQLVVKTSVKSYDVGRVKEGMAVTIKSDATGDTVYKGEIKSIAPTTAKTAQGASASGSDAVFAADVTVLSQDTGLRIGMSVQLNYIVEEQSKVLTVPYDAVYQNETGESCVIAAQEQPNGKYLLTEVSVTTGMETDLDVVISGGGVREGMRVVNVPDAYGTLLGTEVTLTEQSLRTGAGGFTPPFMAAA